jgi:hypothetical protein
LSSIIHVIGETLITSALPERHAVTLVKTVSGWQLGYIDHYSSSEQRATDSIWQFATYQSNISQTKYFAIESGDAK